MNPESPKSPRDELEARLTAMLLGELSAGEAAALRETIARDPDLRRLHDRLKLALELVREASASGLPSAGGFQPPSEPLTLATERRGKLLALFQQPAPAKITQPVAFWTRQRREWLQLAAMIVALMAITGMLTFGFKRNLNIAAADMLEGEALPASKRFLLMLGLPIGGEAPRDGTTQVGALETTIVNESLPELAAAIRSASEVNQTLSFQNGSTNAVTVTYLTAIPAPTDRNRQEAQGKPLIDPKWQGALDKPVGAEVALTTPQPASDFAASAVTVIPPNESLRKYSIPASGPAPAKAAPNRTFAKPSSSPAPATPDGSVRLNLATTDTDVPSQALAYSILSAPAGTPAVQDGERAGVAQRRIAAIALPESLDALADNKQAYFENASGVVAGKDIGGVAQLGGNSLAQSAPATPEPGRDALPRVLEPRSPSAPRTTGRSSLPGEQSAMFRSGGMGGGGGGFGGVAGGGGAVPAGQAGAKAAGAEFDGRTAGGDAVRDLAEKSQSRAEPALAASGKPAGEVGFGVVQLGLTSQDVGGLRYNYEFVDGHKGDLKPGAAPQTAVRAGERLAAQNVELQTAESLSKSKVLADNRAFSLPMNPVAADVSPLHLTPGQNQSRLTSAATAQGEGERGVKLHMDLNRSADPQSVNGLAVQDARRKDNTWSYDPSDPAPAGTTPLAPFAEAKLRNLEDKLERATTLDRESGARGDAALGVKVDSLAARSAPARAAKPASPAGSAAAGDKLAEITDLDMIVPTAPPAPSGPSPTLGRVYKAPAPNAPQGGSVTVMADDYAVSTRPPRPDVVAPGTFMPSVQSVSGVTAPDKANGVERAKEANITVQRSGGAVGGATVNFYALDGAVVANNPVPAQRPARAPQSELDRQALVTDFDSDGAVKARVEGFDAPMDRFKEAQAQGRGSMPAGERSAGAIQFGSGKYDAGKEVKLAEGQIQLMNKRTLEEAVAFATNGFGSGMLYAVDSTAAGRVDAERFVRGATPEALKRMEPESRRLSRIELPGLAEADKEVKAATTARGNLGDVQELAKLTAEPRQLMAERESLEVADMEKKLKQVEQLVEESKQDEMQRKRVLDSGVMLAGEIPSLAGSPSQYVRTNTVETSTRARQEMLKAFDRITLKEFGPFDRVPLSQVIEHLNAESRKLDPEKKGLNLVLDSLPAGRPGGEQVPLGDVKVTIESSLMELPLAYALDAITKSADKQIQFKVEDQGVVFSASKDTTPQLFTRAFKVDPKAFAKGLEGVIPFPPTTPTGKQVGGQGGGGAGSAALTNSTQFAEMVRQYFIAAGVNLNTNASGQSPMVFYNDRNGTLMVRASMQDLENIQQALEVFTVKEPEPPAPPKVAPPNAPVPQPEVSATENAFSTFSLNVSDVSFKLAQASLEKGVMPDVTTVRSEEFINAFNYHDPEPTGHAPIAFAWERARYPFAHDRDLLRFSVKTAASGRQANRPLNLVLLLDNSGSMERADRVLIRQECLRVLAGQLQPQDRISVVAFARTPRLWVDGLAGGQTEELMRRVGGLAPEGGTNLEDAMNVAYQTALKHFLPNGVNRVVLLTDGAANLGDVEPESLKKKVEAQRKQGVALDCFGIGWDGYNDDLLEALSRNGDGRYGFVNTPLAAATEFAGQLAGALKVAASDVKVQVEWNPKRVTTWRQIGYAKHQLKKEQFRDNTVDAAEIAAQEAGNALYTVQVNPRGEGPIGTVRVRFKVPGTNDYREHEWAVPYEGVAKPLEQAGTTIRLAAVASAFSEWLVTSPFAAEVKPDQLLAYLAGVPEQYAADPRPKQLEWMIRQAKSVAGQ